VSFFRSLRAKRLINSIADQKNPRRIPFKAGTTSPTPPWGRRDLPSSPGRRKKHGLVQSGHRHRRPHIAGFSVFRLSGLWFGSLAACGPEDLCEKDLMNRRIVPRSDRVGVDLPHCGRECRQPVTLEPKRVHLVRNPF